MEGARVAAAALVAAGHETSPPSYQLMFDDFMTKYGKVYNGIDEESVRFENFKTNIGIIRASNEGGVRCHLH